MNETDPEPTTPEAQELNIGQAASPAHPVPFIPDPSPSIFMPAFQILQKTYSICTQSKPSAMNNPEQVEGGVSKKKSKEAISGTLKSHNVDESEGITLKSIDVKVQPQEEPGDDETIDKEKPEVETKKEIQIKQPEVEIRPPTTQRIQRRRSYSMIEVEL